MDIEDRVGFGYKLPIDEICNQLTDSAVGVARKDPIHIFAVNR